MRTAVLFTADTVASLQGSPIKISQDRERQHDTTLTLMIGEEQPLVFDAPSAVEGIDVFAVRERSRRERMIGL